MCPVESLSGAKTEKLMQPPLLRRNGPRKLPLVSLFFGVMREFIIHIFTAIGSSFNLKENVNYRNDSYLVFLRPLPFTAMALVLVY